MYFDDKDYERYLNNIMNLVLDKEKFHEKICKVNDLS